MKRCAALVLVALFATGCGSSPTGPTAAEQASSAKSEAAKVKAQKEAAAQKESKAAATKLFNDCTTALQGFDSALSGLNAKLEVGMQFAEYTKAVGAVNVQHSALIKMANAGQLDDTCVSEAATPLENALNAYISANNVWNDCIQDYNCSFDKGSDSLAKAQASWAKATRLISKGEAGLAALQPA